MKPKYTFRSEYIQVPKTIQVPQMIKQPQVIQVPKEIFETKMIPIQVKSYIRKFLMDQAIYIGFSGSENRSGA
jgi:hypothetical protein